MSNDLSEMVTKIPVLIIGGIISAIALYILYFTVIEFDKVVPGVKENIEFIFEDIFSLPDVELVIAIIAVPLAIITYLLKSQKG